MAELLGVVAFTMYFFRRYAGDPLEGEIAARARAT